MNNGNVAQRLFWAAILAAVSGFLWFRIDWLLSLQEPFATAAQMVIVLAFIICAIGVILPPRWAEPVQGIVAVAALFGAAGQIFSSL